MTSSSFAVFRRICRTHNVWHILLALSWFVLSACSGGAGGVDAFIGKDLGTGTDEQPTYSLDFEPSSYDFGDLLITATTPLTKVIKVNNNSQKTLFISAVSGAASTHFSLVSETCTAFATTGLAVKSFCEFTVAFLPQARGLQNFSVNVSFGVSATETNQLATATMIGNGAVPAEITISNSPQLDFGSVVATGNTQKSITLTNTGNLSASAMIGALTGSGFAFVGGSYPGTGGSCTATLGVGASCNLVLNFNPSAVGTYSGSLDINYDDGNGSAAVSSRALAGVGATPASITISDGPGYSFGTNPVGSTTEKIFTLTNSGGVRALTMGSTSLSLPYTFKGGNYPGTGGSCSAQLDSGASCTVVTQFVPTIAGTYVSSLDITYNNGITGQVESRAIQGIAVTRALLTMSDAPSYSFGTTIIGQTKERTVTISNAGQFSSSFMSGAALPAPFAYKGGTYPGVGGNCGVALLGGSSCTVVITYAPTAAGTQTANFRMNYVDGVASANTQLALDGFAVTPATLTLNESSFNFGTKPTGSSTSRIITVTNTGSTQATAINSNALNTHFDFVGGAYPGTGGTCASTLSAAASCTVVIRYAPTTAGTHTTPFQINYNNGLTTVSTSSTYSGTAVAPALLTISDAPTYNFSQRTVGAPAYRTMTISNTGGFSASAIGLTGFSSPFRFRGSSYPGTGGTCAATLAGSSTCTIVVEFSATSVTTFSNSLTLSYFDGNVTQTSSLGLQGEGVAPAQLTLSDGPTYNFGLVPTGANAEKTITVTNTGSSTATTLSGASFTAPFSFKGGSFPGTGATCSASLNAGASCTLIVRFSPTLTGPFSSTLQVNYFDGANNQNTQIALQGNGTTPAVLTISDGATYTFPSMPVGATQTKTFTITNSGGVPATSITGGSFAVPYSFAGGSFPGTGGNCTSSLAATATCQVVVSVNPVTIGTFNTNLVVQYNDGVSAQSTTRALSTQAVTPAQLNLAPATSLNFGNVAVGGNTDGTITVTNGGQFLATSMSGQSLSAPFGYKGGSYPGTGGTCATQLTAGSSCLVVLNLAPTATGALSSTFLIDYFNGVSAQTSSRNLVGNGAAPAQLSISNGPTYDFGKVALNGTVEFTLTVSNNGGVNATSISGAGLSSPFGFKGGAFPGTGGTCGTSLNNGSSCTVVVQFNPQAVGNFSRTLTINYFNGVSSDTSTRDLIGEGVNPALLTLSDGPVFSFGTIPAGGTVDKTFTISNTGDVNATSISSVALTAPFSFKGSAYPGTGGTCGTILGNGSSCTIVITFAPSVVNTYSDQIKINYANGAATVQAQRDISGVGAPVGQITISDGPSYNFGSIPSGGSLTKVFTLTNSGGVPVTSMTANALTAPFSYTGGSYPGTGGTCSTSLNATATCTVSLTYAPVAVAGHSSPLGFTYNNGLSSQSQSISMSGTAVAPAQLTISNGPVYDFNQVAVGGTGDFVFTITNSGSYIATVISGSISGTTFTFRNGAFPGTGGNCGTSLAAGASCTVAVRFSPLSTGLLTSYFTLDYNDGVNSQSSTRNVQGSGATPANLTLSDGATYDYGAIPFGASVDKTFTLSNLGGVTATSLVGTGINIPFSFKGGSYPGTGGTCGTSLASSSNCTLVVSYNPTGAGVDNSTLTVSYFSGVSTLSSNRPVTGTAVAPGLLAITPSSVNFGTVAIGASVDQTLTVNNTGSFTVTSLVASGISGVYTYKGGSYPGSGGTCATSLAPSSSCTVVVSFAPAVGGVVGQTLLLTYNNGVSPQNASVNLSGNGATPAALAFSDSPSYSFGTIAFGSSREKILTLTNSGGVNATSVVLSGLTADISYKGASFPGTGGSCSSTLNAGSSCTVVLTYNPTGIATHNAVLTATFDNGVSSSNTTRSLTGTAASPATLTLSGASPINFGNVAQGGTSSTVLTLSNTGGVSATALAFSGLNAPYGFVGGSFPGTSGTCTTAIASGSSCTINVAFSPTALGTQNTTVIINFDDGVGAQSINRNFSGVGVTPALLTFADGASYNFGLIANTALVDRVFTLTNTGGSSATAVTPAALSAPYTFKDGTFPGTGGDCTSTLSPGASCNIVVRFNPSTSGTYPVTLQLNFNNGATSTSSSINLNGTSAPAANITISDGAIYNFGNVAVNGVADKTFTLTNGGGVNAASLSASAFTGPFSFKGGSYPGTGGTCSTTLANGATCTVIVSYSPVALGNLSSNISIQYGNGLTTVSSTRGIEGTGVTPASITISSSPTYDFTTVAVGAFAETTLTLSNTGSVAAQSINSTGLSTPYSFKGGTYPGTGGNCSTTLAASGSCTLVIRFTPTTTGTFSQTLAINYFDGATTTSSTRPVTGAGAAPALLTVSDGPTYNYGTAPIGATVDKAFTLSNSGGVAALAIAGGGLTTGYSFKGGSFPGTGGTCTTSLSSSSSCTFVVTFAPSTAATLNSQIQISYNDGVATQSSNRDLTGVGVTAAILALSDGPSYSFPTLANGAVSEKTITLSNTGGYIATSIALASSLASPIEYKGGTFPGTGGTCGVSLNFGSNCSIVIRFVPTVTGSYSSSVDLNYNTGATTANVTLPVQGNSAAPANLSISDGPGYSFGTVATTALLEKTFTVTNSGGVSATSVSAMPLGSPYSFKGGTYPGTGGTCSTSVASSGTCQIVVVFNPMSTGSFNDTLSLSYGTGVTTTTSTRTLSGVAAAPASITISDGVTYDYGSLAVGGVSSKSFTITNAGGITATAMSGGLSAGDYAFVGGTYPGTGGTCTGTLAQSATCTVVIQFSPASVGTQNNTLTISYNNGLSAQSSTRGLTGQGLAPAALTISDGATFDFGAVVATGSGEKVFTLTNSGAVAATGINSSALASVFSYKTSAVFPGAGGTCGATLNPGQSCLFVVTFNPATTISYNSTITIGYNNGASVQSATRGIQGTGAAAAQLAFSDTPTYDFSNRANGSSTDRTITISNTGGVAATSLSAPSLTAPFSLKGGSFPGSGGTCTSTLNASATCTIVVNYSPVAIGPHSSPVTLNFNNGLISTNSSINVTGQGVLPALLTWSDAPTYDYLSVAVGAASDKVFTLTNGGSFAASSLSSAALSSGFSFKGGTYPGTGGTCSTSLAQGASCTVVVQFAPGSTGFLSTTLRVSYFNGASSQNSDEALQGTGASPALLILSDSPFYDFGTKAQGSTTDKTLTLSNTGGVGATAISGGGLSGMFNFKGGSFPGTGGTCTSTLANSTNCTIVVTYAPSAVGSHSSTLSVSYNDGVTGQSATRLIQGTAQPPAILTIAEAPTFSYGLVANTATASRTFTVQNTGSFSATSITQSGSTTEFVYKGGSFPGTGGSCSSTIAASSSCTFVVDFSSSSTGTYSTTIQLAYNNGVSAQNSTVLLQGSTAPPATISIAPATALDFGIIANNGNVDGTLTLTNSGGVNATSLTGLALTAPFSYKGGAYPGTGGTCTATLAASAACTVILNYSPTSINTHNSTFTAQYNNGLSTQTAPRNLTGQAVTPALLTISDGSTYDFSTVAVGAYVDKTFTIQNTGAVVASGISGALTTTTHFNFIGGSFPGTSGTCAATLAAGATCTVNVRYAPAGTGIQNNTLTLTYNNGASTTNSTRPLVGTGASPAVLTISDGTIYDFGTRAQNSNTDKLFTITNTGGVTATGISSLALSNGFAIKGGSFPGTGASCSSLLASGSTCTVMVTFTPTSSGVKNSTLSLTYNDGVSAQQSDRPLTGEGATPALITISDGPTFSFGTVANGTMNEKVLTLTNSGGTPATAISATPLSAPFNFKGSSFPGTGGNCSTTLNASSSCTVVVTFSAGSSGSYNDTLTVGYNDGAVVQSSTRPLLGVTAPPASLTFSGGSTYNFSSIASGATVDGTITVTNSGGVTATSMNGLNMTTPFSYKGGTYPGTSGTCAATLASGASCTITMTYSPVSVGTSNSQLRVEFNDGVTIQTASKDITGTALQPAALVLSDSPQYDFGPLALGSSADRTFTVTNTGAVTATSMAGLAFSSTSFKFKGASGYPGTGGNCSTTLAPSAVCQIVVTFDPQATGPLSSSAQIQYFDGAVTQTSVRNVLGNGAAPALITVSEGSTYNFSTTANGATATRTLTLNNTGGVVASSLSGSGLSAPFNFVGGSFPGGGSCTSTLPAGGSCTVVIQFAPTVTSTYNNTLQFNYNNGVSGQVASITITGQSQPPASISISDGATYNFDFVVSGQTVTKSFTLTNTGGVTATTLNGSGLAAPYSFNPSFPGGGGSCGTSLAPAATCTVVVSFNPTSYATFNDTIEINFDNGVTSVTSTRDVVGTGASPASLAISDGATYNFNQVANGGTAEKTFSVTNSGGAPATGISAVSLSNGYVYKGGTYPGTGGNCTTTLAGSGVCNIVVVFNPSSLGALNSTITLNYNDGVTAQSASRPVTGQSVTPANLTFTVPTAYDFGNVPTSSTQEVTFTLTNGGQFAATSVGGSGLTAPITYKGGSYPGTGGTCSSSIAPSASCTVVITFNPLTTGSFNQSALISYFDGASAQNVSRGVTGVGSSPALLTISESEPFDYGTVANGGVAHKTFTIMNTGGVPATAMAGAGVSGAYSYRNGSYPGTGGNCSSVLSSGSSCTVVVTFAPTTTGTLTSSVQINYDNGLLATSSSRGVTGVGAAPASLSISTFAGFGSKETGTTSEQTLTVTNSGGVTATGVSGGGLAAPYNFKGGSYPGTGGTCGTSLALTTCTIIVTYTPTATGGSSDDVEINYNDGVNAQMVARTLSGTGAPPSAPTPLTRITPVSSPFSTSSVTIRVGGVAETNSVALFTDATCSTQVASGTVAAGQTTVDLTWSTMSSDGAYTFYANRTNANGTTSACSTATATFTRDTTPPVLTGITNFTPGRSPHWTTQPVLRAAGTFAGDTINIYSNSGCTTLVTSATSVTGSTRDITIPVLSSEGEYNYYATAVDAYGNTTACTSTPVNYVYDVTDTTVEFTSWYQTVSEGTASVTVTATLPSPKLYPIQLEIKKVGTAIDGTHTSGLASSQIITIPKGNLTASLTFTATNNSDVERERYVDLVLYDSNYEYVHAAGKIFHRVLIEDNDQPGGVPIALPGAHARTSACFISSNKKLYCVGDNQYGQVGDGTTTDRDTYVIIDSANNYKQVSSGEYHHCALTDAGGTDPDGTVKCWGNNNSGRLGDGTTVNKSSPTTISSLGSGNKEIASGQSHSCVVMANNTVRCWGVGGNGQLGNGTANSSTPIVADAGATYVKLALGSNFSCGLTGTTLPAPAKCWGRRDGNGRLGDGSTTAANVATPVTVIGGFTFKKLVAGANHTCGITSTDKIRCWGSNGSGQLGDNSTTARSAPTAPTDNSNFIDVAVGNNHTCAVASGGTLRCTGSGAQGQLMDRLLAENTSVFVSVATENTYSAVTAFYLNTLAVTTGGRVVFGGYDDYYATSGDGASTFNKVNPLTLDNGLTYNSLGNSWAERATCNINSSGKIRCVGHPDVSGMFGINSEPLQTSVTTSDAKNDYIKVAAGRFHSVAIRSNNKLYGSGNAAYNGSGVLTNNWNAVDSSTNYIDVSAGNIHSCGITGTVKPGPLKCWGNNGYGRLGDTTSTNRTTPVLIDSGTTYSEISAGNEHTCGVTSSGVLKCWGRQANNRLGNANGADATVATPTVADSGTNYTKVAVGGGHTCGITTSGALRCFGLNSSGQLGRGNTTTDSLVQTVTAGTNYTAVAANDVNTCAVRSDSKLVCFGSWVYGIAGDVNSNALVPQVIDSSTNYSALSAGRYHMCGLTTSNTVKCWGNNFYHAIGDITSLWYPEAVVTPSFRQQ